jgi:enoyl-CoA hydratase/carnithine racemase
VEAAAKGFVQETVKGKALDRALEIARRIATHTPESVRYIKRLVRGATTTPLAPGLALERNLFMKLCIGEPALERMRNYEAQRITAPSATLR